MRRIVAVIPARMSSSRFPGKPLALICGRPMVEHVYRRTAACDLLDEVIIATCDAEIARVASGFGARTVMTSSTHERASDRVAEAIADHDAEIVVMVQGDEPMIHPDMIRTAVTPLVEDASLNCVNLAAPIRSEQDIGDPNTIKVVMSRSGRALYFSREPIPTRVAHPSAASSWFKQVCVIPFRRDALRRFSSLPRGPLEAAESIDMLRFLENDIAVHVVRTDMETHAVDTPRDLELVASLMSADPWGPAGANGR